MKKPKRDRRRSPAPARRSPAPSGRRLLLVASAVVVAAAGIALALGTKARAQSGNLLLVTLDTTRADALGCYGNPAARTPVLDELARAGCRFARCTTCTPLTLPAHCTLLTSTYPFVHGVRRNGFEPLDAASVTLAEILKGAGFACEAVTGSVVLRSTFGLNQGFDRYADVEARGSQNPAMAERKANSVADLGIAALERLRGGRFFLWLHFYDPHHPYESPRVSDPLSPEAYADEVALVDEQLGRVLAELRRLGLEKKTLVAVLGDHGEGLMEHGESEHGYFVYETTLHVPFLLAGPGLPAKGRTIPALVRTLDLLPTLLDLLGLPAAATAQGRSLRPLLAGKAETATPAAYGETHSPREVFSLCLLRSLTQEGWKYIHSSRPELYDLDADPREQNNLAAAEAERLRRMRDELRATLAAAPPRVSAAGAPVSLTREDAELFRSLGYVGGDPETGTAAPISLELFDAPGEPPSSHTEAIELYARSHRLTAEKRWAESEPILRRVVLDLPSAPHPRRDLALALRQLGREEELLAVLEEAIARHPDVAAPRLDRAARLLEAGRREEAIAEVTEAAARAPSDAAAQLEYGRVLLGNGKLDEARDRFDRALRLDPGRVNALRGLATIASRRDSLPLAAAYLRHALALEPRSAQLQKELDAILARLPR